MFYVGQKVCAIATGKQLREGCVYTVTGLSSLRKAALCPYTGRKSRHGVFLKELENHAFSSEDGRPLGFSPFVLRPVCNRPTDISIFTNMLTPKTEQVSA